MTAAELTRYVRENSKYPNAVDILGSSDVTSDVFRLEKKRIGYEVYYTVCYTERGQRNSERQFSTEKAACTYLKELLEEAGVHLQSNAQ